LGELGSKEFLPEKGGERKFESALAVLLSAKLKFPTTELFFSLASSP
jgi:hypothetical protein